MALAVPLLDTGWRLRAGSFVVSRFSAPTEITCTTGCSIAASARERRRSYLYGVCAVAAAFSLLQTCPTTGSAACC